jgi:serine phosphatase RsbU (regulator of sigma subunit)
MPRRSGARLRIAPSASLALASSTLIALAALAPGGAAAKRAAAADAVEGAPAAALSPAPEAAPSTHATRMAERAARRAERAAASAGEGGAEASTTTTAAARADARQAARAEHQAEKAARREARGRTGDSGAASPSSAGAAAQPLGGAKAQKTHTERAHEHERAREARKREREANGGRLHESRKQREAREAREAKEAKETEFAAGREGGGQRTAPASGVATGTGGAPTAHAPSSAVAGTRTGQAERTHRAARARRTASHSPVPATAATALGLGAALASGTAAAPAGEGAPAAHARHAARRGGKAHTSESPIVRTVTQIVGVIPTALWLLIGVLAFAAAAFAVTSRMAARRARRLDRQRRALLEDVGLLQAALLPELPERLGPVTTSAAYRPASGPGAGGDFYDVFALPEGLLAVIVGDVSGHGRAALPHTTLLRYTLRAYMEAGLSPREALRAAAPALERQLGGSFATVVLASYDPRARRLTYATAGHPHPLVTGLDPDAAIIAGSAPPIGAGRPTGSRQTVVSIPGEGTACFYTDGVIEARAEGKLYGQRRLAAALGAVRARPEGEPEPELSAAELLDRVAAETDKRPDDMAACLLGLAGEHAAPRILSEELLIDAREADGKRARRFLAAAGLGEAEIAATVQRARTIAAEHGSALLSLDLAGERPRVSVMQDNVAPLRARALARTQEVAL